MYWVNDFVSCKIVLVNSWLADVKSSPSNLSFPGEKGTTGWKRSAFSRSKMANGVISIKMGVKIKSCRRIAGETQLIVKELYPPG